jgi:hypothetical protein
VSRWNRETRRRMVNEAEVGVPLKKIRLNNVKNMKEKCILSYFE